MLGNCVNTFYSYHKIALHFLYNNNRPTKKYCQLKGNNRNLLHRLYKFKKQIQTK